MKFLKNIIIKINEKIDNIPVSKQKDIRNNFIIIIIILCIIMIAIGLFAGRKAAKQETTPLIKNTNETFETIIKKENFNGDFNELVKEEEIFTDLKVSDPHKKTYHNNINLKIKSSENIIEPVFFEKKKKQLPEISISEDLSPIDKTAGFSHPKENNVKPLKKTISTKEIKLIDKNKQPVKTPGIINSEGIIEND